jgi:hypothetical protein
VVTNLSDTPNLCILARSYFYCFTFLLVMDSDHFGGGYGNGETYQFSFRGSLTGLQNPVIYFFPHDNLWSVLVPMVAYPKWFMGNWFKKKTQHVCAKERCSSNSKTQVINLKCCSLLNHILVTERNVIL